VTVTLKVSNQFGSEGPQEGTLGYTPFPPVEVDEETWYKVLFPGYVGYYFLPERMLAFV
jgi:hypothetical protein